MIRIRAGIGALIALALAGCAGEQLSLGDAAPEAPPPAPAESMAGRWMLSAPNAPACGMKFGGAPGAHEGNIAPEGGCPGKFFTSRQWVLKDGALTINDYEDAPLGTLKPQGTGFAGEAAAGFPVTLTR
jgi:hypothetical protein